MSNLILPFLPENLESLHGHEQEIHTKAILYINSQSVLKEHLELIQECLNVLYGMLTVHQQRTDDELTLQYLGIRMFNTVVASTKLLLIGYYQVSFAVQRDLLETGFLLDYFASFPQQVSLWKQATDEQLERDFSPVVIRKALDNRDKAQGRKRKEIYKRLCKYASHPSYPGFKLVAPKGLGEIGPFYDEKYLGSSLGELVLRAPYFVLIFLTYFKQLPSNFLKPHTQFLIKYKSWAQKYLKADLSHIDIESVEQLLQLL
ncbi:MAG: hypothetical protein HY590_00745 [Candidatus Omnitrophica bacterium]|nr:hypothetical protein [Candidatus Omnitrophota bacterium]MBI4435934.1 hypothetical protein [Candidatus Omnitrophota bacterium]